MRAAEGDSEALRVALVGVDNSTVERVSLTGKWSR